MWFAGVHSNIGGGYPDDALSYVSLRWILREAINSGLVFNEIFLQQFLASVTPFGTLYDSRKGFAAYYRYDPRKLDPPTDNQRAVIPCPKIHETVFERMTSGSDEYASLSLPNYFKVVRVTADEKDLVEFQRRRVWQARNCAGVAMSLILSNCRYRSEAAVARLEMVIELTGQTKGRWKLFGIRFGGAASLILGRCSLRLCCWPFLSSPKLEREHGLSCSC